MNKKYFLLKYITSQICKDAFGIVKTFLVMGSLLIIFSVALLYAFGTFGVCPVVGVLFGAILLATATLYIRKIYQEAEEKWEYEQVR